MADYFKQKMREKTRARQGLTGDASLPVSKALERSADSKDEWKGQQTTFDESDTAVITSLGGESAALEAPPAERAEKRKKKRKVADELDEDRPAGTKEKKSPKDREKEDGKGFQGGSGDSRCSPSTFVEPETAEKDRRVCTIPCRSRCFPCLSNPLRHD